MAKLPFKINIETESGKEFSYYTGSFAQTTEAEIDASDILSRINIMESSSYSSDAIVDYSGSIQTGVAGQLYQISNGVTVMPVWPAGYHPTGSGMPAVNGRFTFIDSTGLRQVLGYTDIIFASTSWRFNNLTGWRGSGGSTITQTYNGWENLPFSGSANVWLSASLDGTDDSTGFVTFHHTDGEGTPAINNTAHGTNDSADRLKRYRFYGTKVCNVLGFPAGQWQYPVNFQLDDTGTGINYFSGDVNANRLSVARDISFSPISNITSNIRFDIDKTVDKFIQFTSGSAATQENNFLIGYDTGDDQYKIFQPDSYNSYISMVTGSFTKLTGNLRTGEISFGSTGLKILGTPSHSYGSGGNNAYMRFVLNLSNNKSAGINWVLDDDGSIGGPPMSMAIGRNIHPTVGEKIISGSVFVPGSIGLTPDDYDLDDNAFHLYPTYYYGNDTFKVHMDLDVTGDVTVDGNITNAMGWHGSPSRIKIIPTDFMPNDDNSYYNVAVVDDGGKIAVMNASLEAYAMYPIPTGFKATKVRVYGSDTGNWVYVYEGYITNANTNLKGSGNIGASIDITDVPSSILNYLIVKWAPTATDDWLYGGYITIVRI